MAKARKANTNIIFDDSLPTPRYEIFKAENKEICWRFILKRGRGEEVAARASETYKRISGMRPALEKINGKNKYPVIDKR